MAKRVTRKQLVNTLRFIAFAEQAYRNSYGPDYVIREITRVAHQTLADVNMADRAEGKGR